MRLHHIWRENFISDLTGETPRLLYKSQTELYSSSQNWLIV